MARVRIVETRRGFDLRAAALSSLRMLLLLAAAVWLTACGGTPEPATAAPTSTATATSTVAPTATPSLDSGAAAVAAEAQAAELSGEQLAGLATLAGLAPTRTPLPPPTPDALVEGVTALVDDSGLSGERLLWLAYADWLNLAISLSLVAIGYLAGTWVIRGVLPWLVKRTRTSVDDRVLEAVGNHVRWLVVVWILRVATTRLGFLQPSVRTFLLDIYFYAALLIVIGALWRLIDMLVVRVESAANTLAQPERVKSLATLTAWFLRALVLVIAVTIVFSHFAINITGIAILLGIAGLALSLAGRDLLTDIIAGITILVDQPFRTGDRIELRELETTGVVYEVGMRYTRILTVNNRTVIMPNSLMAKNEVINQSYPDVTMSDTTDVQVAWDNDFALVTRLLVAAVRSAEGVNVEMPVEVTVVAFLRDSVTFRAGWWVRSCHDINLVRDRVNRAVHEQLRGEGVQMPYQQLTIIDTHITE